MRIAFVCLLVLLAAGPAHAQQADVLVRAHATGDDTTDLTPVLDRLRRAHRVPVTSAQSFLEQEPLELATVSDLRTLYAVERALQAARAHAAELDEAAALADVARAESHAPALIAIPAGRVFLSEIEIALALVAWQLGNRSLAEASLARAIALDPRRRLRAADADPDFVALADAMLAESERRPRESLLVRADVTASVFVDDDFIGRTPARVEVRAGTHVVRIVAPLHAPYATIVAVERDMALDVALSPRPLATRIAALEVALDDGALEDAVRLLADIERDGRTLAVVFVHEGQSVLCTPAGCTLPTSAHDFDPEAPATHRPHEAIARLGFTAVEASARRGERLRDRRRAERSRRERLRRLLGIGGGIVGAVLVTTVGLVARPTDERLRVDVEFE